MAPVVRFAPSPTGVLHIGNVHTALFNWLFARHESGEFRLRIENTDTSREVADATAGRFRSRFAGSACDWDGEVTFQLDRMEHCRIEAQRLVSEGKAYEDEGAIRMHMADEGITAWDDLIRGRIEYPNEKVEEVVDRARRWPANRTNFGDPGEDWLMGSPHVPSRRRSHFEHAQADPDPRGARCAAARLRPPRQHPRGGWRRSSRSGTARSPPRSSGATGYLPEALVNFLALLGWSYDDKTTIMTREELIERFTLDRVGSSAATFDYAKLDWLNGVYLRALSPAEYADTLLAYLREQGHDWDEGLICAAVPLVQEKIAVLGEFPPFAGFLFGDVDPDPTLLDGVDPVLAAAEEELGRLEPYNRKIDSPSPSGGEA